MSEGGDLDLVAVFPRQQVFSLGTLSPSERPREGKYLPFVDVFKRSYETDAHFVLYKPVPFDETQGPWRLRKRILGEVRAAGGDVLVTVIVVEYDTGKGETHIPWTHTTFDSFMSSYETLEKSQTTFGERLRSAAVVYSTLKGMRWVFRLSRPIPADQAEPKIRGLRAEFVSGGIQVDMATVVSGWNTLFRLPKVARLVSAPDSSSDDEEVDEEKAKEEERKAEEREKTLVLETVHTEESPFFFMEINPERTIDPESIVDLGVPSKSVPRAALRQVQDSKPTPEEAAALLHTVSPTTKHKIQTEFFKAARHRLSGRECFPVIFEEKPLAAEGARSDTIQSMVGQAISLLMPMIEQDKFDLRPAHIYALFEPAASGLMPDQGTPSWTEHLWQAVKRYWADEDAKIRVQEEVKEAKASADEQVRREVEAGVSTWTALPEDPVQARAQVQQYAIVKFRDHHYLINRKGRYDHLGVLKDEIASQVDFLGIQPLVPTTVERSDGRGMRLASYAEMTQGRMVVASDVYLTPQLVDGGYLEFPPGRNPRLRVCAFARRTDLDPTFSPDVDFWFRTWFPLEDDYERFCRLMGCYLAFENGSVPAVALITPPDSGKNLLTEGMKETLVDPLAAVGDDLVGEYNGNLGRTPFVFVNEHWPIGRFVRRPSDVFRALSTGDLQRVNEKYKPTFIIQFSMRIFLLANNDDIVHELVRGQDLGPDDQDALAMRLAYFRTGKEAQELFRERNKEGWTDGWIRGAGTPSRYVVAKHLLWLYEKYGKDAKPRGRHRLLIDGDGDKSPIMDDLRVMGGVTLTVIETILSMLNNPMLKEDGSRGIHVEDSKVSITVGAILEQSRNFIRSRSEELNPKRVAAALKGITRNHGVAGGAAPRRIGGKLARWHEIDVSLLAFEAEKQGWGCDRLDRVVECFKVEGVKDGVNGVEVGA